MDLLVTSSEPQPDPRLPTLSGASQCRTFGAGHFVVCIYILTNVCINKHVMLFGGACPVAQRIKNLPTTPESRFGPWVGKIPWKREWLPTPVFLRGESYGQRSLVSYRPWGPKESEVTE